jgi:hypothetical protein
VTVTVLLVAVMGVVVPGGTPLTVAVSTIGQPEIKFASVYVTIAEHANGVAGGVGARLGKVHVAPVVGSFTTMLVKVTFPGLVTV